MNNNIDDGVTIFKKFEAMIEADTPLEEKKNFQKYPFQELVLTQLYPRIDINVSKGMNHLLKCPFCVHPKSS